MSSFDIRYAILLVINMVKSQASMPWDWNPFGLDSHLNWSKFSLLVVLCTLFSFTSIRVPLACPLNLWHIHVKFGEFSNTLVVLFVSSLVFPQLLFWYAYPIIISISLCSSWVFNMFKSFVQWAKATLSAVPDLNLFISATQTHGANLEQEHV
ncbi:hypothetical protein ACSBR2_037600 [Camellia fascicularis]